MDESDRASQPQQLCANLRLRDRMFGLPEALPDLQEGSGDLRRTA